MLCPYCDCEDSKVIDSRSVNKSIRRRRECLHCRSRFTTYERVQGNTVFVIKKDKRREEFNRDKLLTGVRKACEKRPLPEGTIEKLVDDIEGELYRSGRTEVSSSTIGDMVMDRLRSVDHIAYIRFASVYRDFTDISTLKQEVDTLAKDQKKTTRQQGQLPLILKQEPGSDQPD